MAARSSTKRHETTPHALLGRDDLITIHRPRSPDIAGRCHGGLLRLID